MPIMSKITASYIAGLIDGEGYIGFGVSKRSKYPSYQPRLTIAMVDKTIVSWLKDSFGGYLQIRTPKNPKHNKSYSWTLNGRKLREFLKYVYPYLKIKRQQCEVIMKKFKIQDEIMKNIPYPKISQMSDSSGEKAQCNFSYRQEQRDRIEELYHQIRLLNKRGTGYCNVND